MGMAKAALTLVVLIALTRNADSYSLDASPLATQRESILVQEWSHALDSSSRREVATSKSGNQADSSATPITRVVNLLKEMSTTLQKEMNEDKELYDKLACWCNTNQYEKDNDITAAEAKIAELEASIKALTGKAEELTIAIKQLEEEAVADKNALAEATALREQQIKDFHGGELHKIQAIENLKAAIMVLSKHHSGAFPQLKLSLLAISGEEMPWGSGHETNLERSFDQFMQSSDVPTDDRAEKFLQQQQSADAPSVVAAPAWSGEDAALVRRALTSASAFVQQHHADGYFQSYAPRSGEILGILKQLKDEMSADLSEEQKTETARATLFAELRAAKTAEIDEGERSAERKEDQLAQAQNDLAEAKEDIRQTRDSLSEQQRFVMNLKKTCAEGGANFELRRKSRIEEIHAVSQTIDILMADEARDTFTRTYSFLQLSQHTTDLDRRQRTAALLRRLAATSKNPEFSVLATTVQLDAFTRVKKAIDDMIGILKQQQVDEVTKNDWCVASLHENDKMTMKTESLRDDLSTRLDDLGETIKRLGDEIGQATTQIGELRMMLQRSSENRAAENVDFQKTVADQRATQEVLAKALDKLANFYDKEALTQTGKKAAFAQKSVANKKQSPPVAQMVYKPSFAANGVMQMIEQLIHEAKGLEADARKGEAEAQVQYEAVIADTNGSVAALQQEIVSKTEVRAKATIEKLTTENDLQDTASDLEDLTKETANLHQECDYVQKNFDTRQAARQQEIQALQQAKQILSGADLGER